ncbi:DNA internalization-related competence protein ComEC/Rec2 [Polynucleobacter sp. 15G-AUS-farblos]|nr:DNA internalization-related competence protein ComEC/Rec2 [Polynucleobacter sp. 15G-AUS-farblos]MBU3582643.1 DNA internalization-related competence protein ComEC/Rec2 [Polynucleobacter sp. 15G-AUS-farblos]
MPQVPQYGLLICALSSILSIAVAIIKTNSKRIRQAAVIVLALSLGFAWNVRYAQERLENILISELEGRELTIEGRIAALPQSKSDGAKFAFAVDQAGQERADQFPDRIYLSWQPAWRNPEDIPDIIPGQRWRFKVKLKQPYGTLNPHTFDFERWAFHQNFGASGSVRSGTLLAKREIGLLEFELHMELARWKLRKKIQDLLPKDARYAGVIIALVMGDQNAIDQNDWRVFNATGIGHLISISGLHVTMLAGVGAALAGFIWRRRYLPLLMPVSKVAAAAGFLTAFIYAWLAGFQIPAQRTMYMVGVVGFALWFGRNPRSFDIWWWALLIVLLIDPMAPYTPGFWLSFGAVAAILYAMGNSVGLLGIPTGKELEVHWTQRLMQALLEACRVQAVVTLALLPLTLFWFYQVSIVSPLANAFAIPVVSYIVTPLAIAGALLPDFIGRWLLLAAHISMEYLSECLHWMASWKWSVLWQPQPEWWALLLSGIGITYAIAPGPLSLNWRSRTAALCLLTPLFICFDNAPINPGGFHATVFDIGQGTAVLIETASKKLLYDTGPIQGKKDDAGQRILLPYLQARGIDQIDRMVISHSDSDHVGGVNTLLKHIEFSSMMGSLPITNPLLENLRAKKVPSIPCRYGQRWIWDEVEFYIWHPHEHSLFEKEYSRKPNEMSCVLEVRNKTTSFWLTGDVEKQGEADIVDRLTQTMLAQIGDRELIFMAPHHGSKTSSSEPLLKRLMPDHAFAQNAYRNRYGHPHPTVVERYHSLQIPFLQTPKTGAQIWRLGKNQGGLQIFWRDHSRRLWHRGKAQPSKVKRS